MGHNGGNMLKKRFITALIGVILVLLVCYFGSIYIVAGIGLLSVLGAYEYCRMMENKNYHPPYSLTIGGAIAATLLVAYGFAPYLPIFILVLFLLFYIDKLIRHTSWPELLIAYIGALYVGLGFGYLILLRLSALDFRYILLAFLITWSTDTGAYFIGCRFGRHKLAPKVSPKKTMEGAFGGLLVSLVVGYIYSLIFFEISISTLLLFLILSSCVAQAGDLLESAIKRWAGVKDSGKVLPGHGGVLDRFDSMLVVAPLVYFLFRFITY